MSFTIGKEIIKVSCGIDEYTRLVDKARRRLYLLGSIIPLDGYSGLIDKTPSDDIAENILEYNRIDEGLAIKDRAPVILYIDSPGGDVTTGFKIVDMIELSKTPIYTVNMGQWSSMSFLIGISGHKRFSLPSASFLLHDGSSYAGGTASKVQDRIDFEKRYDAEIVKSHVLKHSNMQSSDYDMYVRYELYMLAEDAKERGFIDEIVTNIDTIL